MPRLKWLTWLIVWLTLGLVGEGLGLLLAAQGWHGVGAALVWLFRLLTTAWLAYGLYTWRHIPWVRRFANLVISSWVVLLLSLYCVALQWNGAAIAFVGAWTMAVGFYLGLQGIRLIFSPGWSLLGVARTLVDEAIRMKVPLVFIIALVLILPVMPLAMDPQELLKYRIQSFLTWSMMTVSMLLSLMTMFLAVGTITNEITRRQIFLTMTKPLTRVQYLLGKWIGIAALNLLLVAVCGGGIYVFTRMLDQQPARDQSDAEAVEQQVLVARVAVGPLPGGGADLQVFYDQRLEWLRARDPATYARPVDAELTRQIQQYVLEQWRSIAPRNQKVYLFSGLGKARRRGQTVQLRLMPKAGGVTVDDNVYLNLQINGRDFPVPALANNRYHVLEIPSESIDERGDLRISITNAVVNNREQPSIGFSAKDGLEVLYRVGGFEGNLIRSLALLWIRLCFLAMLGLAAGTFLGFPIASLLCLMVYFAAAGSAYVMESLDYYSAFPAPTLSVFEKILWWPTELWNEAVVKGRVWEAIKIVVRTLGSGFMLMVPPFGDYNPTPLVSDGRLVSYRIVASAGLWIGLVWTGTVGIIGWLIFRRRELARIIV